MSVCITVNAVIESAKITANDYDKGILGCWLFLKCGNGLGQGFGGYALYLPKGFSHHDIESVAGHYLYRVMEIAGVTEWKDLPGKTIRIRKQDGWSATIEAIGHIVNDDWFDPKADFEYLKNKETK